MEFYCDHFDKSHCNLILFVAGAKAVADVDVSRNKYAMNIIMPSSEETDEFRLTFESVSLVIHYYRIVITMLLSSSV